MRAFERSFNKVGVEASASGRPGPVDRDAVIQYSIIVISSVVILYEMVLYDDTNIIHRFVKEKNGNFIPMSVQVGDIILMEKYSGQEVTLDDEEFVILRADDIIAIVEQ